MPNNHRNRFLKTTWLSLLAILLLWNLGAGQPPASALQGLELTTPPGTQTDTAFLTDLSVTQTPVPTEIYTSTPGIATVEPTSASDENDLSSANRLTLPAVFAAGSYAQDELVVRFKPSASGRRIDECFQGIDIRIQSEIEELRTFVLKTAPGETASVFYHVLECAGALYVEPNFLLQAADTIPNDPNWGLQYGLSNIRAPQGWDLSTGSPAVTIAILDTGVDQGHIDLAGKLVAGYDFVNNDSDPQDDNGHGTHVAGIAAAFGNNGAGIAGVSWGARIMPVKVLNSSGGGTYANTTDGVIWAVDHGAQVINLSLGGVGESKILEDAVNYAHSRGVVVVAAAGNAGNNFVLYPARYPNVIAVAMTDSANNWDDSNFGPEIDLAAPGAAVYSTVIGGYDYKSGSSMSTGFVSGLAAILAGIPGNASPDLIKFQMESTALDIEFSGWDEYTGAGLIQMDAAIALVLGSVQPTAALASAPAGDGRSGLVQGPASNTPVPLHTVSPTLLAQTVTSTQTFEPGPTSTETAPPATSGSPTGSANEVQAQGEPGRNNYLLPCTGLALILLGVLLVLAFRRK